MTTVPSPTGKHLSRVTADQIALYYSKGCKMFPTMYTLYLDQLTLLERQGKISLTPKTVLERYHLELRRRIEQRVRRISKAIGC